MALYDHTGNSPLHDDTDNKSCATSATPVDYHLIDEYNLPRLKRFYKRHGQKAQAPRGECIYIAESSQHGILAAARLQPAADNIRLLRSMFVDPSIQRRGIGSALLLAMQATLSLYDCYTFPYTHLESFYANANFQRIDPAEAPDVIRSRYQRYLSQGRDILIMKHMPAS